MMTGIYQESSHGFIIGPVKLLDYNYVKSKLSEDECNELMNIYNQCENIKEIFNALDKYEYRIDTTKNRVKYYISISFRCSYYSLRKRHSVMSVLSNSNDGININITERRIKIDKTIRKRVTWIKNDPNLQFILKNRLLNWIYLFNYNRVRTTWYKYTDTSKRLQLILSSIYYELKSYFVPIILS